MNKKKLAIAVALSVLSVSSNATSRIDAMGGTGVVSSNYIESPFYNPANLADFKSNDDFGFMISGSLFVNDNDDLIDKIDLSKESFDVFESTYNELNGLVTEALADPASMIGRETELLDLKNATVLNANLFADDIASLSGESLSSLTNFQISLAIPNRYVSTAIFAKSSLSLSGDVIIGDDDLANLRGFANALDIIDYGTSVGIPSFDVEGDITSNALILGNNVLDVGIALAHKFEIKEDYSISIGITPKYQRVDILAYRTDVEVFTEDDFTEDEYLFDDGNFNIDVGINFEFLKNWKFSFVGNNLIENIYEKEFTFRNSSTYTAKYEISPQYKAGLLYSNSFLTTSVEADLTVDEMNKTKFIKAGLELDAFDWVQVRAGYRVDTEEVIGDSLTVGVGLSPFGTLAIDLVAMKTESINERDGQLGAGVSLSFKF